MVCSATCLLPILAVLTRDLAPILPMGFDLERDIQAGKLLMIMVPPASLRKKLLKALWTIPKSEPQLESAGFEIKLCYAFLLEAQNLFG